MATETLTAGVDIKNVAFVFVWMLASLAKMFQSAGRAGRGDGLHEPAACVGHNPTKFQALIYEAHWTVRVSHEAKAKGSNLAALHAVQTPPTGKCHAPLFSPGQFGFSAEESGFSAESTSSKAQTLLAQAPSSSTASLAPPPNWRSDLSISVACHENELHAAKDKCTRLEDLLGDETRCKRLLGDVLR